MDVVIEFVVYVLFYIVDDENNKVFVVRIGHALIDWENLLK